MATQWDQLAKRMAEVKAAKEAAKTIKGNQDIPQNKLGQSART